MSILPAVRVILDKKLENEACAEIHEKISAVKGVLSTHFNEKSKEIMVTYSGSMLVKQEIAKIKGVAAVRHQL